MHIPITQREQVSSIERLSGFHLKRQSIDFCGSVDFIRIDLIRSELGVSVADSVFYIFFV